VLEQGKRRGCRESALCRRLGFTQRTVQNWRKKGLADRRKGAPKRVSNKLSEAERALVVKTACAPRFVNLNPHEIVPILAEENVYLASESTFYRLLRLMKMIKPKRKGRRQAQAIELKADGPNRLWSWDITYLKTFIRGRFYFLYLIIDVFSRYITGWEIHETEDARAAREFVERVCREHGIERDALILHSDNGSPMRSGTMLATLQALGVVSSFSRPSVSNDNAFSESLFKTLKYTAGYPTQFESLEAANEWTSRFADWYNTVHRHSGIGYVTPEQRHFGLDKSILLKRKAAYEAARLAHPERWSGRVRAWNRVEAVWLKKPNLKQKCA
jgi:putative transposase